MYGSFTNIADYYSETLGSGVWAPEVAAAFEQDSFVYRLASKPLSQRHPALAFDWPVVDQAKGQNCMTKVLRV